MKNILLLATTLSILVSCTTDSIETKNTPSNVQENDYTTSENIYKSTKPTLNEDTVIEINIVTRGFYQQINITKNELTKYSSGIVSNITNPISTISWEKLNAEFSGLRLSKIPYYKAPSDMRLYDGAFTETLTITHLGQTYTSMPYDAGNPPARLKNFITYAKSL
jgi:hypothetical protein